MTKEQKFRYEMFVRVRDFGTTNSDVFPESTTGGQAFGQVMEAVSAIEDHLLKRDLARAEAQRVKAATRASVREHMKTIAHTARRMAGTNPGANLFKMPARKSATAVITRARLFVTEAEKRKDEFARLGLPPTFISELHSMVDTLDRAVKVRQNSRSMRHTAQAGIETALVRGFDAIRELDVVVANALRLDPVRLAGWRGARRIEGQGSSASASVNVPVPVAMPVEQALVEEPAVESHEDAPVEPVAATPAATLEQASIDLLRRAS